MKRFLGAIALLAVGAVTASASADSLSLTGKFKGFQFGSQGMTVKAGTQTINTSVGMFKWENPLDGNSTFNTFCTELTQNIANNQTVQYDINDVSDVPIPNNANFPHLDGGMGDFRAGLLQNLYHKHYGEVNNTNTSAAFQLAVWAIVYETDTLQIEVDKDNPANNAYHGIKVDEGSFYISSGLSETVKNLANGWLAGLVSVDVANLFALSNGQHQDQIIVIPLPAPVLMAGLGLLAIPLMRRRLIKR